MSLLIIILFAFLPFFPVLPGFFGFDFVLVRLFAIIIFFIWLFISFFQKRLFFPINITTFFLFFFLFMAGISGFWAIDKELWFRKFLFLINVFLLYFPLSQISSRIFIKIPQVLFYSGFAISLVGIIQFLIQFFVPKEDFLQGFFNFFGPIFYGNDLRLMVLEYPSFFVSIGGQDYLRAFGLFASPQNLALFIGMVLFLSFYVKDKISKQVFYSGIFLMVIAILLTLSRGAYVAFITTILFYAMKAAFNFKFLYLLQNFKKQIIFKKILHYKFKLLTFIFVVLVFLSLLIALNPAIQRLADTFSFNDNSRLSRIDLWQKSFAVFKENPLFGVGLGSFPIYIEPDKDARAPVNAHNTYLEIMAELGLVGFIAFLLTLIYGNLKLMIYDLKIKNINFYFFLSICYFLVFSFFETTIYFFQAMALLTFILSVKNHTKNKFKIKI